MSVTLIAVGTQCHRQRANFALLIFFFPIVLSLQRNTDWVSCRKKRWTEWNSVSYGI